MPHGGGISYYTTQRLVVVNADGMEVELPLISDMQINMIAEDVPHFFDGDVPDFVRAREPQIELRLRFRGADALEMIDVVADEN
jgi:hypothetical protein